MLEFPDGFALGRKLDMGVGCVNLRAVEWPMSAMRISCMTPASIRRVLKVWRRSWKRTWRIPAFLSAVFHERFTMRTGRPWKSITSPSFLR